MPSKQFKFTEARIRELKAQPTGKNYCVYDTETSGFGLRVSGKGTKTFIWYRSLHGQPERVKIGHFPDKSVEEARKEAAELNRERDNGISAKQKRHKIKNETTLGELHKLYIDGYAKDECSTWEKMRNSFELWFDDWNDRRLSTITKSDIQSRINELRKVTDKDILAAERRAQKAKRKAVKARLFAKLEQLKQERLEDGPSKHPNRANKAHNDIRAVFQWAINNNHFSGTNPCIGISRPSVDARERFIQPQEFAGFFQAMANEGNANIRDFIWLCLWSGARKTNVLEARWEHVNFELATWYIPMTKNGESQTIPLNDAAMRLLRERYNDCKSNPWVFPSDTSDSGHLVEPKRAWHRILKQAGISNLRLHDLRRTMGSYMAIGGFSPTIIGKALGHKSQAATAIYARLTTDPVLQAMESASNAMLKHAGVIEQKDNLLELKTG